MHHDDDDFDAYDELDADLEQQDAGWRSEREAHHAHGRTRAAMEADDDAAWEWDDPEAIDDEDETPDDGEEADEDGEDDADDDEGDWDEWTDDGRV